LERRHGFGPIFPRERLENIFRLSLVAALTVLT